MENPSTEPAEQPRVKEYPSSRPGIKFVLILIVVVIGLAIYLLSV